jgi:predicted CXXCH cytochrome family protein
MSETERLTFLWLKSGLALVILVGLLLAVPAAAKKHPVPLDPKTDAATCLKCHEGVSKGKAVHSAMGAGCTACHEVRVNRGITRVKLVTTTAAGLCLTCHAGKGAAEKSASHTRAVPNCLKCHDPHSAEFPNQLRKDTQGNEQDNLCLSCHAQITQSPPSGSRHAALEMGCSTCHTLHRAGDAGRPEFAAHLSKASPALCLDCHTGGDAALVQAHRGQPFAGADCVACHDPHTSALPKTLQKFVHQPFAEKACEACHQPAEKGKVVLTQPQADALCAACHDETVKKIEAAKVSHPGAAAGCSQCHSPHAGKTPGLVKSDPVSICLNCHAAQGELRATKKVHHPPAYRDGCAVCHEPHGGDKPKLLRAEGNALCLACHSAEAKAAEVQGAALVTIFDGKVRLPADYFRNVTRLGLGAGKGHPTRNHPIDDFADPLDPQKVTRINCLTCHQPHAGGARAMLVTNTRPNAQLCRMCHQGMIGVRP